MGGKAKDRTYQFWERNSLGVELRSHDVFMQKLEYIHWNPVKAGLCSLPEEYYYSSAKFYWTGIDDYAIVGLMTNNLNLISCNVFCKIAGKQCLLVIRPTRAFQRGWINYYSLFNKEEAHGVFYYLNELIRKWIKNTYKIIGRKRLHKKYQLIQAENPLLFYHWKIGIKA